MNPAPLALVAIGAAGSVALWKAWPAIMEALRNMDDNAKILTRMSLVEIGSDGTTEEIAAMMAAACNRAAREGRTIWDVVHGIGGPWAGRGRQEEYNRIMDAKPVTATRYAVAVSVLAGWRPAGPREHFVHPANAAFSSPSASRPRRDPETGRYLPGWSIARENGGSAPFPPVTIGQTRLT